MRQSTRWPDNIHACWTGYLYCGTRSSLVSRTVTANRMPGEKYNVVLLYVYCISLKPTRGPSGLQTYLKFRQAADKS